MQPRVDIGATNITLSEGRAATIDSSGCMWLKLIETSTLKKKMKFTWNTRIWGWRTLNQNAQPMEQAGMLASYWLMSSRNEDKNLPIVCVHGFR